MKEVLHRRYSRMVAEGEPLPQLVVVDGGKGQLSAAVEAFDEMGIRGEVALVGIAKRLEEIYFPATSCRSTSTRRAVACRWCRRCARRGPPVWHHPPSPAPLERAGGKRARLNKGDRGGRCKGSDEGAQKRETHTRGRPRNS